VKVAQSYQDTTPFGVVKSRDLVAHIKSDHVPFIAVMNGDEPADYEVYGGSLTDEDSINAWVSDNRFSLLPQLSGSNYQAISTAGKLTVIATVNPATEERTKPFLQTLKKVAKTANKQKFNFAWVNAIEYASFVNRFGLSHYPNAVIVNAVTNQFYNAPIRGDSDATVEVLSQFLKDAEENKLSPGGSSSWYNSEHFFLYVAGACLVLAILLAIIIWFVINNDSKPVNKPQQQTQEAAKKHE